MMPTHSTMADLIAHAEGVVGVALETELAEHLQLARQVTNIAGELVEHIETAPGDPRAIHVGTTLLARLVTDLQACCLLIRRGYAGQAVALTAGMLELAHSSMYIGANERLAQEWLSHADPKRAAPWSLKKSIHEVALEMGIDDPTPREYDVVYRDANMAKHGNPMALGQLQLATREDSTFILVGPNPSAGARRAAHVGLLNAIRYTKLAAVKFARDHLLGTPTADRAFEEFTGMSDQFRMLTARAVADFRDIDSHGEA